MGNQREIPTAAKTWGLRKHTVTKRRPKDKDRGPYVANVTQLCKSPAADESGEVAERWPVAEFSIRHVLAQWGPGRYSVDWYDKANNKIDTWKFDAAEPRSRPRSVDVDGDGGAVDDSPVARLRGLAANMDGGGVFELVLALNAAGDQAAARARAEADARADRERQFWQQQADSNRALLQQVHTAPAAASPAAGGLTAADFTREMAMVRREMAVQAREDRILLRQEILNELPDPDAGHETVKDAANAAGVAAVEEIGEMLPGVVVEGLKWVKKRLAAAGTEPTPENIAAAVRAVLEEEARAVAEAEAGANGAAHAEE